jgi:hypothetical protein
MALADRNDPIEALLIDRSDEAFGVGIRIKIATRPTSNCQIVIGPISLKAAGHRQAPGTEAPGEQ